MLTLPKWSLSGLFLITVAGIAQHGLTAQASPGHSDSQAVNHELELHDQGFWHDVEVHEDGWLRTPWFGWFQDYSNWIYHLEHDWWYVVGESSSNFYMYDSGMALWGWSAEGIYPWIYWYHPVTTWSLYVRGGSPGERRFYHANADLWRHESALRGDAIVATPAMVRVEGGGLPGTSDLGPLEVSTFYIRNYEVTWEEWREVRDWAVSNGYDLDNIGEGCTDEHPVHSVNWYDVIKWLNAKSEMNGLTPAYTINGATYRTGAFMAEWQTAADGYRLPTDEEWEFAARGGTQSQGYNYSGSDDLDEIGWHWGNTFERTCVIMNHRGTAVVAQKLANELGLHDMSGNVWEWTWDESVAGFTRHIRGGSWLTNELSSEQASPYAAAVSSRGVRDPDYRSSAGGFRIARN